jgi:hypothetical protein
MQSNEYSAYDAYDYVDAAVDPHEEDGLLVVPGQPGRTLDINFDDPKIASMPKILFVGPRRGGKTSIQVRSLSKNAQTCFRFISKQTNRITLGYLYNNS